jgi:hypothetical protein
MHHCELSIITQEVSLGDAEQRHVFTCFAVADPIKAVYTSTAATICDVPWSTFMSTRSATAEDIWPGIAEHERTLWRVSTPYHSDIVTNSTASMLV